MRIVNYYILFTTLILCISGCGGADGKDKVGSLSLAVSPSVLSGGQFSVSAIATYTNPNTSNLVGTEVTFDTSPPGLVAGFPKTYSMPTNGIQGTNILLNQTAANLNFFVIARIGDLVDSKIVSMPALGTVTASPTSLTFITTEVPPSQHSISISGGTSPYIASSSVNSLVTTSVTGNTVTVTRVSVGTGIAVITIQDAVGASTTVTVTLQ